MKISSRIKRNLRLKYTAIMILLAMALTALGLPCVAQTPDSAAVENPAVYDNLLRPSAPVDTTAGTPEIILDGIREEAVAEPSGGEYHPPAATADTIAIISGYPQSIYGRPASWTYSAPWWHGMWINTAVYAGAFVGTLFVLECLPEDATAWNRKEITSRPFYERWYRNVFKLGPEWDHDKFIFNYVLHPYAGAAYFMAARSCGFNFWQSMLYSAAISTIGWEFGIEACMERPSYQDIFVTPIVGSLMGEGFYRLKRLIVNRDYRVLGSPAIGHICAFFLDPVNEVVGLLSPPSRCRTIGPGCLHSQPLLIPTPGPGGSPAFGLTVNATF